jgi:hypothetical protein
VKSLADGIVGKALCRNPKCRKKFEIPESSQEKPRLCPECRAKEGGIQVSEETKCSIEECEEERVLHRAVCKKHYNEAQRKSREAGKRPGQKPKKAGEKPMGSHLGAPSRPSKPPSKPIPVPSAKAVEAQMEGTFEPLIALSLDELLEVVVGASGYDSPQRLAYLRGYMAGKR